MSPSDIIIIAILEKIIHLFEKIYLSPHGQERTPQRGILLRRRLQPRTLYKETILVILRFDLEVGLWMIAYWTYFRCFLADADMSAVCALPDNVVIFGEYEFFLYVIKKF